jgi:hypothetical protein
MVTKSMDFGNKSSKIVDVVEDADGNGETGQGKAEPVTLAGRQQRALPVSTAFALGVSGNLFQSRSVETTRIISCWCPMDSFAASSAF